MLRERQGLEEEINAEVVADPHRDGPKNEMPRLGDVLDGKESSPDAFEEIGDFDQRGTFLPPFPRGADNHHDQNDDEDDDVHQEVAHVAEPFLRKPFLQGRLSALVYDQMGKQVVVQQQCDDEQEKPADNVEGTFEDDSAEGFLEGDVLVALEEGAAEDFAEAGQGEVGQVTNHHGVEHHGEAGIVLDGFEQKFRTGGANDVGQHNCHSREEDEKPSARIVDQCHRRENHLDVLFA